VLVRCIDNLAELEPYRGAWEALADGNVFRSWTWLSTWWRHYGQLDSRRALCVFLAESKADQDATLMALLPCYIESSWTQGRVLRLLGDGEVCSDHLGMLSVAAESTCAAEAIASCVADREDWDLLDFASVDEDDVATTQFHEALLDCSTSRLMTDRCWTIDLPSTWEEFLAMQSKSHRKQLRQLQRRVLESDLAGWRLVQSLDEFGGAWATLVDLHQRRRQTLRQPGCFSSTTWAAFHWDVAQLLLTEGRLRLSTLELEGKPIAAEYHLAGADATFAYQGGVDPDRLEDEPGQLSMICSIKRAIDEGHRQFDLLRGDEPYKAHWRAAPRQALRLIAVPGRTWPKVRHRTWQATREFARAARQLTGFFS
jgi:CelD/BcsL family acetyltransferase involved in cellulose biosynthesis